MIVAVLLLTIATPIYLVANQTFTPIFKPTLEIDRAKGEIRIDGEFDDPGWHLAATADYFHETYPQELAPPPVNTKVMLTYDDVNLYVAFCCEDNPSQIRATMCQRDMFHGDDDVGIAIDTYGNATRAYEFFVNAHGVQKDLLWSNVAGEDDGFDMIWHSAARITANGYQVEMAIPFSSLRFPRKDIQSWNLNFYRHRPREIQNSYSWAAIDRNEQCSVCQWGQVEGIRDVQPGHGLELLPSFVANQNGMFVDSDEAGSGFHNNDIDGQIALGGKYSPTSDVTIEAAYNPDFSQIEADAAQIDVNTTMALFYPERRPFFQEGSDLFRTLFNSFYTRTINDPTFAAKAVGRFNGTNITMVSAVDENSPYIVPLEEQSLLFSPGRSFVNVMRGLHTIGNNNTVGFLISDRRYEDNGSGTVGALDFDMKLSSNYRLDGQYILTRTHEPTNSGITSDFDGLTFDDGNHTVAFDGETYYGTAFISRFRRHARHLNFGIDYNQVSPTYRTQIGYDPINKHRTFRNWAHYNFLFDNSPMLQRITPGFHNFRRWSFDGTKKQEWYTFGLDGSFRFAQTWAAINYNFGEELYRGVLFDDLWSLELNINSRPNDKLGFYLGLDLRNTIARYDMLTGRETAIYAGLNLKPSDRLIVEPNFNYAKNTAIGSNELLYEGYIFRTRMGYQASKALSLRFIFQYNDFNERWDIDPLVTYRLNSFTVLYVGSAYDYGSYINGPNDSKDWRLNSRQFFMKIQYLLRV